MPLLLSLLALLLATVPYSWWQRRRQQWLLTMTILSVVLVLLNNHLIACLLSFPTKTFMLINPKWKKRRLFSQWCVYSWRFYARSSIGFRGIHALSRTTVLTNLSCHTHTNAHTNTYKIMDTMEKKPVSNQKTLRIEHDRHAAEKNRKFLRKTKKNRMDNGDCEWF